jgi:tRNA threonylcarbamoyladenosine biosynthesis protein TsaB
MLILAADTSGKQGSIALAQCGDGEICALDIIEVVPLTGGAFSAELVPRIAALLEKHGYRKSDLEAFAVASGPGSFTGLRVGLAAFKALAEALQKPIVAVSLLEAVACSGATHGRVLTGLDAGRGDVYVGDYEFGPQISAHALMRSERLLSREEFVAEVISSNSAKAGLGESKLEAVVTPDAALVAAVQFATEAAGIAQGIHVELIEYPNSSVIARLGWERLQRGETVAPEALEANYIRHSDAEIFSKPKP